MARRSIKVLNVKLVASLTKPGRHGDGNGLYLNISAGGSKSWVYIFGWRRKKYEMGLGGLADVSLAQARELAADARSLVKKDRNPILERKLGGLKRETTPTFGDYYKRYLSSIEKSWKNDKHRAQWHMTLEVYAADLHARLMSDIDTGDVYSVLTKNDLWNSKPETASRLRGRIEKVWSAAKTEGLCSGENPARWKGHLENLLPKPKKLTRGHFASMPFEHLPAFVQRLRSDTKITALALEFHILCASRPGMVEHMEPGDIDFLNAMWVIPKERMKLDRDHYVPLPPRAIEILKFMAKFPKRKKVFFTTRPDKALSDGSLRQVMIRHGAGEYTPHGMRTSFRDWAGDETFHEEEVAELALAHSVGDDTKKAYRRRQAVRKRRALMEDWERYLNSEPGAAAQPRSLRRPDALPLQQG